MIEPRTTSVIPARHSRFQIYNLKIAILKVLNYARARAMLMVGQKSTDKRDLSGISRLGLKTLKAKYYYFLKKMSTFFSKCKDSETVLLKESKDQNYLQIESLPNEILVGIFSYLDKKEIRNISMVNKRWLQVGNYEIDYLLLKWPK